MDDKYQDQIDNYLLNRMSHDERSDFEKELTNNETLRRQLEDTRMIKEAICSISEKRELIDEWSKTEQKQQTLHKRLYWCSAVAAILVIGYVLKPYILTNEEAFIYRQIELGANYKGGMSEVTINNALLDKNYDNALALVDSAIVAINKEIDELDKKTTMNPDEKEYLRAAGKNQLTRLNWYKANALLGLKRLDEAKVILKELRLGEGPIPSAADSLLNTLQ